MMNRVIEERIILFNLKKIPSVEMQKDFLQTKPQIKSMNINYYDLYYTVNKNRDGKEEEEEEEEEEEQHEEEEYDNVCNNKPNHSVGIHNDDVSLRWTKGDLT